MNKRYWLSVSILLLFISGLSGQSKTLLSAPEFQEKIKDTVVQILDVRTSQEYNAGHITHAFLADWLNEKQFRERVEHLDKTRPLFVYCGSGVRSSDAAKWLRNNGFKQVYELQNGIVGWKKNKGPLETETPTKQLTKIDYNAMVAAAPLVLIDFGAKWCPPCKKMEPVLEQLQSTLQGKFVLQKIDAGIQIDLMEQLDVKELPTFILYKAGNEVWRKTGLVELEELKTILQKNF